jgi:hypothetical protein
MRYVSSDEDCKFWDFLVLFRFPQMGPRVIHYSTRKKMPNIRLILSIICHRYFYTNHFITWFVYFLVCFGDNQLIPRNDSWHRKSSTARHFQNGRHNTAKIQHYSISKVAFNYFFLDRLSPLFLHQPFHNLVRLFPGLFWGQPIDSAGGSDSLCK